VTISRLSFCRIHLLQSTAASSTPTSTLTWISWFCSLPGHDYFCEVAEDFIEDDFNLTGLNAMVPFWKEAMEMVLDVEPGTY
jgi:casein kinase II subunit beta